METLPIVTNPNRQPTILILGPLPPPLFGPAIATQILINSALKGLFNLVHLDTNIHKDLSTLGKFRIASLIGNHRLYLTLVWLIISQKPDIVLIPISQTTKGFIKDSVYIWICRLMKRTIVIQLRGSIFKTWFRSRSGLLKKFISSTLICTQAVIVLGAKLRELFEDFYPSERIFVVPNGCDVDLPPPPDKDDTKLRLLYLSNLQSSKGIEDVIQAVDLIAKTESSDEILLDVVGSWRDDQLKSELTDRCRLHKMPVRFHPPVDGREKYEFFVNADVFLFTPRGPEGHPWVIIEAMAAGLPIISTDQGAITESVVDGINGFIVETRCPEQIAEKILLLMLNPELRRRMGEASRKMYLEHFTEAKMVQRLNCVFNTILERHCTSS